jgi:uncharacterized protein (TIGR04540 family)
MLDDFKECIMRAVYKNPRELGTCLKDLVDLYLDGLMSYEKLTEKILKMVDVNEVYKNGHIESKLLIVLGEDRKEIIDKIVEERA